MLARAWTRYKDTFSGSDDQFREAGWNFGQTRLKKRVLISLAEMMNSLVDRLLVMVALIVVFIAMDMLMVFGELQLRNGYANRNPIILLLLLLLPLPFLSMETGRY